MNLMLRNPSTHSKLKWLNGKAKKNEIKHKKLVNIRMKQAVH